MNIFVLDEDPVVAAHMACNAHVVKIAIETYQMLHIPFHLQGLRAMTKGPSHKNHPVSVWLRESRENFEWSCEYGIALCEEYWVRYGKDKGRQHACRDKVLFAYKQRKRLAFDSRGLTPFAQAMPEECRRDSAVEAYKVYYETCKRHLFSWSKEEPPAMG